MSVTWILGGAATENSFWIRGRVTGDSVRLVVSESPDLSSPAFFGPVTPDAADVASIRAEDLDHDTQYFYAFEVDGDVFDEFSGKIHTHPRLGRAASFSFIAGGDAGLAGSTPGAEHIEQGVSNNPVFDTAREQSDQEGHLFAAHLGDKWYRDNTSTDLSAFRAAWDDFLTFNGTQGANARQGRFWRNQAAQFAADDHDLMGNNTDASSPGRDNYLRAYRESAPHYALPAGDGADGIYQSWQVGRVLFLQSDVRAYRDPNLNLDNDPEHRKTMLGADQVRWMEQTLKVAPDAGAEALVWIMPSLWMSDVGEMAATGQTMSGAGWSSDSWRYFRHERERLVELFGDYGWLDRMIQLTADKHALSISSGPSNPFGGFPVYMFASWDASFANYTETAYDLGQTVGRQRYGTVDVQDYGHGISLTGTGWVNGEAWRSHASYVQVAPHVLALNYARGEVFDPFTPTADDQLTSNDITVDRRDGGTAHSEATQGPMSVAPPPEGVGRYSDSVTLNVDADEDLHHQAGWRVHKGTVEGERWPAIGQNLANPRLEHNRLNIASTEVGDMIRVDDPPEWLPPEPIRATVEGYSERIKRHEWEIEYNCSPGEVSRVAEVSHPINLLPNPDFAVNTAHWTLEPSGGRDLVTFASGGASARLPTLTPPTQTRELATRLEFSPRAFPTMGYEVGAVVRCDAEAEVRLVVRFYGTDDTRLATHNLLLESVPAGEWVTIRRTTVSPTNPEVARAQVVVRILPGAAGTAWVDRVWFTEGTGVRPWPGEPNRFDTSHSILLKPVEAVEESMVVHSVQTATTGSRWINSRGPTQTHPHDFPLDLRLGGEVVRVTGAEPLLWDTFQRDTTAGWGTADCGLDWELAEGGQPVEGETGGAPERWVEHGAARVRLTGDTHVWRHQTLPLDLADFDVYAKVTIDQDAEGGSLVPSVLVRWAGIENHAIVRLSLAPSGGMAISVWQAGVGNLTGNHPCGEYEPGDPIFVRVRVIGQRILARAWRNVVPDTGPQAVGPHLNLAYLEPHGWQIDVTPDIPLAEQGRTGMLMHALSSNTNTDPVLTCHAFHLMTPQVMDIQRGVNTIHRGHAAGTPIALDTPAIVGL